MCPARSRRIFQIFNVACIPEKPGLLHFGHQLIFVAEKKGAG
jgi:hypothetical protein